MNDVKSEDLGWLRKSFRFAAAVGTDRVIPFLMLQCASLPSWCYQAAGRPANKTSRYHKRKMIRIHKEYKDKRMTMTRNLSLHTHYRQKLKFLYSKISSSSYSSTLQLHSMNNLNFSLYFLLNTFCSRWFRNRFSFTFRYITY